MPAVLVHGVPETPAVWNALRSKLQRDDIVTPQLPGFGCPRPAGFGATKEDYVAWLVGELEQIKAAQGPIDLVGHDWGGGLTVRLVSTRADLVRSWACDAAGLGHPDFEWHDFAKIWQTPVEGEKFYADNIATPADERGAVFELFGVPHDEAIALGRPLDQTMADCILALYRSATNVGKEWANDFQNIEPPGRVIIPSDDGFLNGDHSRDSARRTGASVTDLDGLGHWWMLQDPARGAAMLEEFWATV